MEACRDRGRRHRRREETVPSNSRKEKKKQSLESVMMNREREKLSNKRDGLYDVIRVRDRLVRSYRQV